MPLTDILRIRVILDLIQDGNVANEAAYSAAAIEKIAAPIVLKYATSIANERGLVVLDNATPPQPRAPTNEELAAFLLKSLKQYITGIHIHQKQVVDEKAARNAAIASTTIETTTDLGQ